MTERLTYSIEEAGQALGIGKDSVYELTRRGELRSVRVGRRILIPRAAVEEYLGITRGESPAPAGGAGRDHPGLVEEATYIVTIRRMPSDHRGL